MEVYFIGRLPDVSEHRFHELMHVSNETRKPVVLVFSGECQVDYGTGSKVSGLSIFVLNHSE